MGVAGGSLGRKTAHQRARPVTPGGDTMQKEDFGTKVNPQSISAPTLSLEVCPSPLPASPPLLPSTARTLLSSGQEPEDGGKVIAK